jgi:hypothetical protein
VACSGCPIRALRLLNTVHRVDRFTVLPLHGGLTSMHWALLTRLTWALGVLTDITSKVCQGPDFPKGYARFL